MVKLFMIGPNTEKILLDSIMCGVSVYLPMQKQNILAHFMCTCLFRCHLLYDIA